MYAWNSPHKIEAGAMQEMHYRMRVLVAILLLQLVFFFSYRVFCAVDFLRSCNRRPAAEAAASASKHPTVPEAPCVAA